MRLQYELTEDTRKVVRSEVAQLSASARNLSLALLFLGTCVFAAAVIFRAVKVTHVRGG